MNSELSSIILEPIVRMALHEDLGRAGDITSQALIPSSTKASWFMRTRQSGVIAGFDAAILALKLIDESAKLEILKGNGAIVAKGDIAARVSGSAQSLLTAERTMLNFIGRMSGIATLTNQFVNEIAGTGAQIADTRKTTPGLRALEKQAVRLGGGSNHRYGLDDAILIKDNHIAAAGGIENALYAAKAKSGHLVPIEVEVDSIEQLVLALPFYPTCIMLDNFSNESLKVAVSLIHDFAADRIIIEASGGVNLNSVRAIAETGVDIISVGALTHSAPNFDIGLDSE